MSNPRIRGLVYLAVALVVAWFFCVLLPFTALPAAGLGVGLPVITVPGEVIHYQWFGSMNLTNTLMGGFLASFLVLLWAALSYRSTKGWTEEVPDRWQAWTEVFVETFYDFLEGLAGDKLRTTPLLWPIAAAIFIFLLAGNWGKLLPGVESVGYLHCGYVGFSGYPRLGEGENGRLWVSGALDAGTSQTEELEEACALQMKILGIYYGDYDPEDYAEEREAFYERLAVIEGDVPEAFASVTPLVPDSTLQLTSTLGAEEPETAVEEVANEPATGTCLAFLEDEDEVVAEPVDAAVEAEADHGEEEAEAEAEATEEVAEDEEAEAEATEDGEADAEETEDGEEAESASASLMLTSTLGAEEGDDHSEEASFYFDTVEPEAVAVAFADLQAAEESHNNGEISNLALEEARCELTQMIHPMAVFPLSLDQLQNNNIQPYVFTLAPFFRGVATDLSFNFGLAILVVVAVQVYGVIALGPAYFEKFVNLSAIGNIRKNPAGIIDFVVGLIEIISEIGKIISLAFRLFGNLFAGGVALLVMMFLVDFFVPGVILLLEVVIGLVQALVFSLLLVVFTTQAMEAHHGDDHDEHGDHADAH